MTNAVNIAQSGSNNQTMRNRIINGAMVIDQRNAGAAVAVSNGYVVDRFNGTFSAGTITGQQSSTAPAGFNNSLSVTVTSSSSGTSTTRSIIEQRIEGFNAVDLGFGTANPQPFTVSFWCRSSVAGTYSGSITDTSTRSYPFSFSIPSANTWVQISTTITADTSGSNWSKTNGTGLALRICLGSGSSFLGTANAWTNGNLDGVTGTTNWINTAGATVFLTGVQLEEGTAASPFENRLYGTELQLCQRYYEVGGIGTCGGWGSTTTASLGYRHTVTKRSSPTVSLSTQTLSVLDPGVANRTTSTATISTITEISTSGFRCDLNNFSGAVQSRPAILMTECFAISSEL